MTKAKKQHKQQAHSSGRIRVIRPWEEMPEDDEMEEDESGMFLEKEDAEILLNALKNYTPTEEEEQRYELLLEEFDEILVVNYGKPMEGVNDDE